MDIGKTAKKIDKVSSAWLDAIRTGKFGRSRDYDLADLKADLEFINIKSREIQQEVGVELE